MNKTYCFGERFREGSDWRAKAGPRVRENETSSSLVKQGVRMVKGRKGGQEQGPREE